MSRKTYTTFEFDYDIGEYQVIGYAEICIYDNGDGSGRTFTDLAIEEVIIDEVLDEDMSEVLLSPEELEAIEDAVVERIKDSDFELDLL
jgi:hypothetical protein